MNNEYYDLFYTVTKSGNENEVVNEKYENIENENIKYNDFITPKKYVGIKNDNVMLS